MTKIPENEKLVAVISYNIVLKKIDRSSWNSFQVIAVWNLGL
jgi:hypothetical protein